MDWNELLEGLKEIKKKYPQLMDDEVVIESDPSGESVPVIGLSYIIVGDGVDQPFLTLKK